MSLAAVVVGIDVGGPRKGFHAVALRDGNYLAQLVTSEARTVAGWCRGMDARAVGIDAPCRWSLSGRARTAERVLAAQGIRAFATPSRAAAQDHDFYRWMLQGAELFGLVERDYRLFDGRVGASAPVCFETFPHAVTCALAGEIVCARHKAAVRRELLRQAGVDTAALTHIDTVDAALCALTAQYVLSGHFNTYGDAKEGFILVPAPIPAAL